MAPQDGLEPPTQALTVPCSTTELLGNILSYKQCVNISAYLISITEYLLCVNYYLKMFANNLSTSGYDVIA
jgi:hypothetical protein